MSHAALFPDLVAPALEGATSDDWFTPKEIVQWATTVLRTIDTDPAWSPASHVRARQLAFDGRKTDGLAHAWRGTVWCNPPYSAPEPWIRRCALHESPTLCLVKFDPSTRAWSRWVWPHACAVVAFGSRLKFEQPGKRATCAPFPSACIAYRLQPAALSRLADAPGCAAVLRPPW